MFDTIALVPYQHNGPKGTVGSRISLEEIPKVGDEIFLEGMSFYISKLVVNPPADACSFWQRVEYSLGMKKPGEISHIVFSGGTLEKELGLLKLAKERKNGWQNSGGT